MSRFASAAALAAVMGLTACSGNSGSGLTTSSILDSTATGAAAEVAQFRNDDPNARPVYVAWTSARAQRCGFYFDAAKLKASYLAYEQTQGVSGPAVATLDKNYDAAQKNLAAKVAEDPGYCQGRRADLVKADLNRLLGGDYRSNFPESKQKVAEKAGFMDYFWGDGDGKKLEATEYFRKMDREKVR